MILAEQRLKDDDRPIQLDNVDFSQAMFRLKVTKYLKRSSTHIYQ